MLGHKASLNKFKQLEILQSLFYIKKYNKLLNLSVTHREKAHSSKASTQCVFTK